MSEKESEKNLVEAFRGLPLMNKVIDILEKKEFIDPGDNIRIGNVIIGVMSPLERSIYTVIEQPTNKIKELGTCPHGTLDSGCLSSFSFELGFCPFVDQLTIIKTEHKNNKTLRDMMFALIKSRLDTNIREIESIHLDSKFCITTTSPIPVPETIEVFENFEQMGLEEMLEVSLRGTFLEPIIGVLKSGEFKDIPDSIVEGELFLREMTPFEKAMCTTLMSISETIDPMIEEHTKLLRGENFISSTRPKIDVQSFGGIGIMISIGGSGHEEHFEPKDKNHPDVLRIMELKKEIEKGKTKGNFITELLTSIIKMSIDEEKINEFDSIGIRAGFQIVASNNTEE